MTDTGEKKSSLFKRFSLGGFCVIKYILKNLLNYPLTSSTTTSWDRIILKLYTYCSIIQQRIFYICQSIFLIFSFLPFMMLTLEYVKTSDSLTHLNNQPLATTNAKLGGCVSLSEQQASSGYVNDMTLHTSNTIALNVDVLYLCLCVLERKISTGKRRKN